MSASSADSKPRCYVCGVVATTGTVDKRFHLRLCPECLPHWQRTDLLMDFAVRRFGYAHPTATPFSTDS